MEMVPIASLSTDISPQPNVTIRGVVTLSWPYSSSTQRCALLLADPDFRLRNHRGQIRVQFTGASAKAVAKSRVHIGDEVILALGGAAWVQAAETTRTPGKSVDGELVYGRRLSLKIVRPGKEELLLDIDAASPHRSSDAPFRDTVMQTPVAKSITQLRKSLGNAEGVYTSPAFAKRRRLSEKSLVYFSDELVTDDIFSTEHKEKKARKSWTGITHWQYTETTPSPSRSSAGSENVANREPSLPSLDGGMVTDIALPIPQQWDESNREDTLLAAREAFPALPGVPSSSLSSSLSSSSNQQGSNNGLHHTTLADETERPSATSVSKVDPQVAPRHSQLSTQEDDVQNGKLGRSHTPPDTAEQPEDVGVQQNISPLSSLRLRAQLKQADDLISQYQSVAWNGQHDEVSIPQLREQSAAKSPEKAGENLKIFPGRESPLHMAPDASYPISLDEEEVVKVSASSPGDEYIDIEAVDKGVTGGLDSKSNPSTESIVDDAEGERNGPGQMEDIMTDRQRSISPGNPRPRLDNDQQGSADKEGNAEVASPESAAPPSTRDVLPFGYQSVIDFSVMKTPTPACLVQSSPQSEKQQMMVQTFKSLFGFRSPERRANDSELRQTPIRDSSNIENPVTIFPESPEDPDNTVKLFEEARPEPLLNNLPVDGTIEFNTSASTSIAAEASSPSSMSFIHQLESGSRRESEDPELVSQNTAPLLEELPPQHRSPSASLAEVHVLEDTAVPAQSTLPSARDDFTVSTPEVVAQAEPDESVPAVLLTPAFASDHEQSSFLNRSIISPTPIGFSTPQETTLQRLFGFSSPSDETFHFMDSEGVLDKASDTGNSNRKKDHHFPIDAISQQDSRYPVETAGAGEVSFDGTISREAAMNDSRFERNDNASPSVQTLGLSHGVEFHPNSEKVDKIMGSPEIDTIVIPESQQTQVVKDIEEYMSGSDGSIADSELVRHERNASMGASIPTKFTESVSASLQPGQLSRTDDTGHISIADVSAIADTHGHMAIEAIGNQVGFHQDESHDRDELVPNDSNLTAAALNVESDSPEGDTAPPQSASSSLSPDVVPVDRPDVDDILTPSFSFSYSSHVVEPVLVPSHEQIVSPQRSRDSSPASITSGGFGVEQPQSPSAMDWYSPEVANSQSTGEVIDEESAPLVAGFTHREQARRASMARVGEGEEDDVSIVQEVSPSVHQSRLASRGEREVLVNADSNSLRATHLPVDVHATKDDVVTTVIELDGLSPGLPLSSGSFDELSELRKLRSVAPDVDDAAPSKPAGETMVREHDAETITADAGEGIEDSSQKDVETHLLHGFDGQTSDVESMMVPRATLEHGDISTRAQQETHTLPLTPTDSQFRAAESEQVNRMMINSNGINDILPPTPQLTQVHSELDSTRPDTIGDEMLSREQASPHHQGPPTTRKQIEHGEEKTSTTTPKRRSVRRSLGNRFSYVPEVISAWFSPRPAHVDISERDLESQPDGIAPPDIQQDDPTKLRSSRRRSTRQHSLEILSSAGKGITTSFGYYHPLASIERLINPSSQQTFGTNNIDILALVVDKTSPAQRAKSGPRDFFTVLRVHDPSLQNTANVRVEVYRPWRAKLPEADVGDVILLRSFVVKSKKHQTYLLSTDTSAWCVWRYADPSTTNGEQREKPIWAHKVSDSAGVVAREEMKGPQVEFGDEERDYARALRAEWLRESGIHHAETSKG